MASPITPAVPYDAYTGNPVHRFYQMWRQANCNTANITQARIPAAAFLTWCLSLRLPSAPATPDARPAGFDQLSTGEGSNGMQFYNTAQGDAPFLTELTRSFSMSDNYHQPVMGGTMVQRLMLGYADLTGYGDGQGNPMAPAANLIDYRKPLPGTDNFYTRDGGGANFSNCSDLTQPGVAPIVNFLQSLPKAVAPNCQPGVFYGLNNVSPSSMKTARSKTGLCLPAQQRPSHRRSADAEGNFICLLRRALGPRRCPRTQPLNICNPFQYANDIMSDPVNGAHPGHRRPASKRLRRVARSDRLCQAGRHCRRPPGFIEARYLRKLCGRRSSTNWGATMNCGKDCHVCTFDEGGGYYDSGYIQPLDYFGDGPHMPISWSRRSTRR